MLRLALLGIRGRRSAFAGAAVALFVAAVLVTACGVLLASGLRSSPAPERYAAPGRRRATSRRSITASAATTARTSLLLERVRVDVRARRPACGDRRACRRVSRPSRSAREVLAGGAPSPAPGDHARSRTAGRAPRSTPLALTLAAGRPRGAGEVVVDARARPPRRLRVGARVRLGSHRAAPRRVTVVGIAAPRRPLERQAAVFVTDAEARRGSSGHPGPRRTRSALLPGAGTSTTRPSRPRRAAPRPAGVVVLHRRRERGAPEFLDVRRRPRGPDGR